VQAQPGVGTPLHFPEVAGEDTLSTLEFGAALHAVAGYAVGPLAAARLRARRPAADIGWIRRELASVGEALALLRRGEGIAVAPVPELHATAARLRIGGSVLEAPDLLAVRQVLTAGRLVVAELQRVRDHAPLLYGRMPELPPRALERRLAESVDEETGELLDTASPELASARREVQAARDRLVRKLESLLRSLGPQTVPAGAGVTMREGRYVIPVRRDSRSRPDGIVHDESATAGTLFIEPAGAVEFGNALRSAIAAEQRETLRIFRELTDLLRPERECLLALHECCLDVDQVVARAKYAHRWGAELPSVTGEAGPLVLRAARHPLLLERLEQVVPFDLELGEGARTLLVSGPNTGGKTVLLKTAGLAAMLTQAGIVPPVGGGTVLPVFTRAFADIGDHQSIAADLSTFSAHLALLRRVLEEADDRTLVLLDEIGSGTDPAEGAALAGAALRALTLRGTTTLATTHLGALKMLPGRVPGIVNGSLEFDTATLSPTYRFQAGVPGRSYGLAIARRLGIAGAVLEEAEREVPAGERALEALLASAEARDRELREGLGALAEREAEMAGLADRLAAREARLAAREAEVAARERTADRRAREAAREYLLAARAEVEAALAGARTASDEAAREARRVIEEAIHREGQAIAALTEPAAPAGGSPGAVSVGRRVRTTAGATGTVAEVRSDGRLVVTAGAMRFVVPAESVAPLPDAPAAARVAESAAPAAGSPAGVAAMEIDLRGFRADEAEMATVAAIDAAVLAEHPHLRIIHGMGTGVVRDRVRRVLQQDRRVARFAFAPRAQGGTGVTIAELTG
jgi:DNA mismatch repair protein MutS2